jgi:cytochrome P450
MVIDKLLTYPEFGARLRQEAVDIFKNPDKPETWTSDEMSQLKFHECFLAETLRLEPMVRAVVRRTCVKDGGLTFSDGTYVPHGFDVSIATDQVHLDERFWKNPSSFDPNRWLNRTHILPYTDGSDYFAFGTGRHLW